MMKQEWVNRLEEYLNSDECNAYTEEIKRNHKLNYLISVLFGELDGDWNLINWEDINETDIEQLRTYLEYGQQIVDRGHIADEYTHFSRLERNYDLCTATKRYLEDVRSQLLNRKIDCI